MLELLNIKHDIYARSLSGSLQSEYVVRFNETPDVRVLLMDVKCGAHGLNLSSASRIYFVNPVCRPNIEAQAIKRAHRIGQTREVHVETLVLAGTMEEQMQDRATRMTSAEHIEAKTLEDDGGIREIIQSARCLSIAREEVETSCAMAPLDYPEQLWGRPGWSTGSTTPPTIYGSLEDSEENGPQERQDSADGDSGVVQSGRTKRFRFDPVVFEERTDAKPKVSKSEAPDGSPGEAPGPGIGIERIEISS
jgi:hypothetical protein